MHIRQGGWHSSSLTYRGMILTMFRYAIYAGVALGSLASHPAIAKDLLPLERGIFTLAEIACKDRSNADSRSFWGDKLNSSTAACKITQLKVSGQRYSYVQDCFDSNENASLKEPVTLLVQDRKRFSVIHAPDYYGKTETKYRWCAYRMFD